MIYYVTYEIDTGTILDYGSDTGIGVPNDGLGNYDFSGFDYGSNLAAKQCIEDFEWEAHYVDNGEFVALQHFALTVPATAIVADANDIATIGNVPMGTEVAWPDGLIQICDDGLVELQVDAAGTHTFRFAKRGYFDQEVSIEAIAAD